MKQSVPYAGEAYKSEGFILVSATTKGIMKKIWSREHNEKCFCFFFPLGKRKGTKKEKGDKTGCEKQH